MRRHPLIDRRLLLLGATLIALLVVAGGAARLTATSPAGVDVTITTAPGERLEFEPAATTVRATGPLRIAFRNGSSLPHNLVFRAGLSGATRTIVEAGGADEVRLDPPGPGSYAFACTIHEGMSGTLVVVGD